MQRLTIAIPTYNRPELLEQTVRALLPQLTPDCKLLILDNASLVPVDDVLKDLIAKYPRADIKIHRNRFNVGGACNQMRCFELCDSEWVWTLGDDDIPCENAIKKILTTLEKYPDCIFYNFTCPALRLENKLSARKNDTITAGIQEFISQLDHFSSIQFMSLNVYHVDSFIKYIRHGIAFSYSAQGHVAMIIKGLEENLMACCSSKDIIPVHGGGINKDWSRLVLAVSCSSLLEISLRDSDKKWDDQFRKLLSKKILGSVLKLKTLGTILLDDLNNQKRTLDEAQFLFTQICSKTFYYEDDFATQCLIAIYKIIFRIPFIGTILRKVPILNKLIFNEKK